MVAVSPKPSQSAIDTQILRALVRKLMGNGILSQDDVRALLADAIAHLDEQTPMDASPSSDHG